jgi:3-oxoacyl-[acyl-carrier-protein] synthase-3
VVRCRIESLGVSLPRRTLFKHGSIAHAVEAGRRCLKASHHRPADVGLIVNAGVHRDDHVCEPAGATYIQHKLGVNVEFQGRRTLSFDLLNGGCGMLNAAQVVVSQLAGGELSAGMVVASEANSDRRPDPGYPYPASGAALLLDRSPLSRAGFGAFAFQTHEEHAELYTSVVSLAAKRGRLLLRRRAGLEEAWLAAAGAVVDEVLEKDGLGRDEIDFAVPAQISPGFLARLPAAVGLPADKVVDLTAQLPDTLSTSMVLALGRTLAARRPGPGAKALLLVFGSGITVGAATYRF